MEARYAPRREAIESRLGDETVLLHLENGIYFGLDAIGTVVWERLKLGDTIEGLCIHVRSYFEDAPATLEEDINAFLGQLLEQELIELR